MKVSPLAKVRDLYENSAESYAAMMDAEIDLPVYSNTLARLAERIVDISGPLVDTSCGSGHMLFMYRERFDPERRLVGIDLSPRMVSIARTRLDPSVEVFTGDMRELQQVETGSAAAALSFFALHHLGPDEVPPALAEWRRVLRPGGQLLVATWEGTGAIDYGEESDVVALKYTERQIVDWTEAAGFLVDRCVVEPVAGMSMDAIYVEGTRQ